MPNFSQIGAETAESRLAEMKKKLDCRNLRLLHKSSPTAVSPRPLYLHSRSVPSPSQSNAQIAISGRFEHGVKWGCIKTFKPISATTLNIFVKLRYNVAQILYINRLVVVFRHFSCLPNHEWSNLRFVHRSRLPKTRHKFDLTQFSE